jgi:methyl-accepting chemotaxis protein
MKINMKLLSLFGFLIQILLFLPFAKKFFLIPGNYVIYLVIILINFVSTLILLPKFTLVGTFYIYFLTTLFAFVIAGLTLQNYSNNFLPLFIAGIITGIFVGIVLYFMRKNLYQKDYKGGFHFIVENTLLFFALSSYVIGLILNLPSDSIIMLYCVLLLISLLISVVIQISLNTAVKQLESAINEKAMTPDYTTNIPALKRLYSTINSFFGKITSSLKEIERLGVEIRNSSEDLSSASEEMNASLEEVSSTIQHIAKGAQDQSEAITAIARSIEELDKLTTSISSQVKMANVSSRRTTDSAKKGMEFSIQQARILKDIFEQTRFIEDKMSKLRDQATEIKKIVDIIQGITEQTDLLALNAAIEAARVGEQGKGFAVVADEIRNLANETQQSSTTVENLINEINKTIQELNNLLNLEREKIDEANASASQTEEEFSGIVKAVNLVTDMISRINEAAVNQLNNTKELVKRIEQVAQVAADTAAATEEVSAAVEEQTASMEQFTSTAQLLSQVVAKLNEILEVIKK